MSPFSQKLISLISKYRIVFLYSSHGSNGNYATAALARLFKESASSDPEAFKNLKGKLVVGVEGIQRALSLPQQRSEQAVHGFVGRHERALGFQPLPSQVIQQINRSYDYFAHRSKIDITSMEDLSVYPLDSKFYPQNGLWSPARSLLFSEAHKQHSRLGNAQVEFHALDTPATDYGLTRDRSELAFHIEESASFFPYEKRDIMDKYDQEIREMKAQYRTIAKEPHVAEFIFHRQAISRLCTKHYALLRVRLTNNNIIAQNIASVMRATKSQQEESTYVICFGSAHMVNFENPRPRQQRDIIYSMHHELARIMQSEGGFEQNSMAVVICDSENGFPDLFAPVTGTAVNYQSFVEQYLDYIYHTIRAEQKGADDTNTLRVCASYKKGFPYLISPHLYYSQVHLSPEIMAYYKRYQEKMEKNRLLQSIDSKSCRVM